MCFLQSLENRDNESRLCYMRLLEKNGFGACMPVCFLGGLNLVLSLPICYSIASLALGVVCVQIWSLCSGCVTVGAVAMTHVRVFGKSIYSSLGIAFRGLQ